ncbi:MAG: methylated-DNA--[protein]-cysteine S-methyltransferase [Pirellulaceae bacterium]
MATPIPMQKRPVAKANQNQVEQAISFFKTKLGWVGLHSVPKGVLHVRFGYSRKSDVESACVPFGVGNWTDTRHERWVQWFQRYSDGEPIDLARIPLAAETQLTSFAQSVRRALQAVPWGETLSYGQLAILAGRPGAARAVGTVMRKNETPLIVPCHRVLASCGLGGFSSHRGTEMKRRLLELEGSWNEGGLG